MELVNQTGDVTVESGAQPRPFAGYVRLESPLDPAHVQVWQLAAKRVIDVAIASVLIVVLSPVFVAAAVVVFCDSRGPVLFRQRRLGMNMREFTILKFRTMVADADDGVHRVYIKETMTGNAAPSANGLFKLVREDQVTRSGRWLRQLSIDELPQLFNVIRGQMSLVGPRPCLMYECEHFEPHHFERFCVPAGITGLWQVTTRAKATFREALELDVAYARRFSLRLDFKIILATPLQIVRQRQTS
jgi:lipopolysaccharide/colanic/teichoic acid biosynthesis glycosyltransferase